MQYGNLWIMTAASATKRLDHNLPSYPPWQRPSFISLVPSTRMALQYTLTSFYLLLRLVLLTLLLGSTTLPYVLPFQPATLYSLLPPSSPHHPIDLLALAFPQNLPSLSSLFVKALPHSPLVLQTSAYSNLIHFSTNHTTPMVPVNQNHPYLALAVSRVDHQSLACVQIPPLRLRSLYLRCPTTARPHLSLELLSPLRIRPFTWVRKRRRKRRSSWPRSFAQLLPLPNLSYIPKKSPTNSNWTLT
jgi:hypothetical protein